MAYKRYSEEQRVKAIEMMSLYGLTEVSEMLNIPITTLKTWKDGKTKKSKETLINFEEVRKEKKAEFVAKAWDGLILGQNRLINELKDPEAKISARDLAIIVGTLYDKQALASNEATLNAGIKIVLGGDLDKYAD